MTLTTLRVLHWHYQMSRSEGYWLSVGDAVVQPDCKSTVQVEVLPNLDEGLSVGSELEG